MDDFGKGIDPNRAMREMTVAEYIDRAIADAQRRVDGLRELKQSLPSGYLDHGCSTLAHVLKLT